MDIEQFNCDYDHPNEEVSLQPSASHVFSTIENVLESCEHSCMSEENKDFIIEATLLCLPWIFQQDDQWNQLCANN